MKGGGGRGNHAMRLPHVLVSSRCIAYNPDSRLDEIQSDNLW